ncbi:MAG TPA: hypothetical protein VFW65_30525 [Pseudonocardiaceae bacterium]|nr:hypothetical protein [Pseudonocardiaceae bacterium]
MMWIFGQVWFACLVGFAVGVLLDWVVRVRPLSNKVADLEARLAADARSARQDGEYGRSVFDRGPFASANLTRDGFAANRNRGGLLTPGGSLATDLLDDTDSGERESRSGVEDFPGVARISEAWEEEAEEATRAAPAPWQPGVPPTPPSTPAPAPATEHFESWQPEEPWQPERADEPVGRESQWLPGEPAAERTEITSWLGGDPERTGPPVLPPVPSTEDADAQYLDFLRSGANQAPSTADSDEVTHGEVAAPGAADVTSVMPQIEGYEAYESYADEYEQNGDRSGQLTGDFAGEDNGFHFGEYRYEDVEEPAESSTPLPRREVSREASLRFAPFESPFQSPFESPFQESELVDAQRQRPGDMTPIEEGGFQPFQKPTAADGYDSRWLGEDGGTHGGREFAADAQPSTNGTHVMTDAGTSLFEPAGWQPEGPVTQRILPVSRPDLDHPDLLRESVFGTEHDTIYEDDPSPSRSLFEPVVPPEAAAEGYQSYQDDGFLPDLAEVPPGYGEPTYDEPQGYDEPQQPYEERYEPQPDRSFDDRPGRTETTEEFATDGFLDQPPTARPVRVRTGVDGPVTQSIPMPPVPPADQPPAQTTGPVDQDNGGGPFGPGSALPKPDGSAPSPQFQVKARTSSMVFHTSSSPFFDRLEPQVWFRSPEDAQRAGFTSWERPHSN